MRVKCLIRALCISLALLVVLPICALADTDVPYMTYNYDYWGDVMYSPAAYLPSGNINGAMFSFNGSPIGAFRDPQDLCVSPSGDIFLADSGNNRVIVFDASLSNVKRVITGFERDGVFNAFRSPQGVAVSLKGQIYVSDTANRRVVVLNDDGTLAKIVENPQSDVLGSDFVFSPLKVAVDYADRIYVIADRMFQGIMVFESDGRFTGFFGTINVSISLWDRFWRSLATKEERAKQRLYIPTEFTGIDVDNEGFVFASNVDTTGTQAVRRLNPRGQDVIRKGIRDSLGGDIWMEGFSEYSGASKIVDVVYRGNGIYSLLDSRRGRIFTYDHEGNLLYIFGGLGTQAGTFTTPSAIDYTGDRIIALDRAQAAILTFKPTEYGRLIDKAVALRFDGDEKQAVALWERVLELDENNELANTGIGKAYLAAGDNAAAMKYLKRGMNRSYYSVAFKRYRNELFKENLEYILTGGAVFIILLIVFFKAVVPRIRKRREGRARS